VTNTRGDGILIISNASKTEDASFLVTSKQCRRRPSLKVRLQGNRCFVTGDIQTFFSYVNDEWTFLYLLVPPSARPL